MNLDIYPIVNEIREMSAMVPVVTLITLLVTISLTLFIASVLSKGELLPRALSIVSSVSSLIKSHFLLGHFVTEYLIGRNLVSDNIQQDIKYIGILNFISIILIAITSLTRDKS